MVLQVVLLRALRVQENFVNAEVQRGCAVLIPSKGTNLLILIILAGDIEMNPGPNAVSAKNIARHQKNRLNVKNAKSAFTHHASVLTKRNCWN